MRTVIIDDDAHARSRLRRLCGQHDDVSVVALVASGAEGIDCIRSCRPDLVLLDVELRDMSGFDVLRSPGVRGDVMAIMVTAHAKYALPAFEYELIDYVTKPVEPQRFCNALERVRRRLSTAAVQEREEGTRAAERADEPVTREARILGEKAQRLYFLEATAVDYIQANGNYMMIHAGADTYISRSTLARMAGMLAPLGFLRIDRSLLVNLGRVSFAERLRQRGEVALTLHSGARLVSGKAYRKVILQELRQGLKRL